MYGKRILYLMKWVTSPKFLYLTWSTLEERLNVTFQTVAFDSHGKQENSAESAPSRN